MFDIPYLLESYTISLKQETKEQDKTLVFPSRSICGFLQDRSSDTGTYLGNLIFNTSDNKALPTCLLCLLPTGSAGGFSIVGESICSVKLYAISTSHHL